MICFCFFRGGPPRQEDGEAFPSMANQTQRASTTQPKKKERFKWGGATSRKPRVQRPVCVHRTTQALPGRSGLREMRHVRDFSSPWALDVLAGPGNPRDQKSYLFVTNRVAIRPFFAFLVRKSAESRRGSRQIGPPPSISSFFDHFYM